MEIHWFLLSFLLFPFLADVLFCNISLDVSLWDACLLPSLRSINIFMAILIGWWTCPSAVGSITCLKYHLRTPAPHSVGRHSCPSIPNSTWWAPSPGPGVLGPIPLSLRKMRMICLSCRPGVHSPTALAALLDDKGRSTRASSLSAADMLDACKRTAARLDIRWPAAVAETTSPSQPSWSCWKRWRVPGGTVHTAAEVRASWFNSEVMDTRGMLPMEPLVSAHIHPRPPLLSSRTPAHPSKWDSFHSVLTERMYRATQRIRQACTRRPHRPLGQREGRYTGHADSNFGSALASMQGEEKRGRSTPALSSVEGGSPTAAEMQDYPRTQVQGPTTSRGYCGTGLGLFQTSLSGSVCLEHLLYAFPHLALIPPTRVRE